MRRFCTILIALLTLMSTKGQTIEFSLSYLGLNETTNNFQIALIATASSSITNATVEDLGGGFYLPSGLTIGNFTLGNSGLPASEWTSQSMGSNSSGDAYFLSRVEAGGNSINLNGSGPFQLILFEVIADPNPTSGRIVFVENGDPIFDSLFIQNYINLNVGSGPVDAYSQNDPLANNVDFSTLGYDNEIFLDDLSLYPNPTDGSIFIKGNTQVLSDIEIFTISGRLLMHLEKNYGTIDIQSLDSGIYFVKLNTLSASKTIKIIKE